MLDRSQLAPSDFSRLFLDHLIERFVGNQRVYEGTIESLGNPPQGSQPDRARRCSRFSLLRTP